MNHKINDKIIENSFFDTKKITILFIGCIISGVLIRCYYLEYNLPVTLDALSHFFYAKDISLIDKLPTNYSLANNGWGIFLSFFFKIFSYENVIDYMNLQRWISIIISTSTIIPVYFLTKKFFNEKIALISGALFIFEPRIIFNSLLGITEPLYIFLATTSMVFFLSEKRKLVIISFVIIALASIVRSEGLFLFFGISIMFFVKFRKDKLKIFFKYSISLLLFLIIIIPMINYKIETVGHDTFFGRIVETGVYVSQDPKMTDGKSGYPYLTTGVQNFIKFLGWNTIPLFLIFIPIGIYLYLKKLNLNKISIIVFSICLSLPALHAYGGSNLDSRYLFIFYPIFCIITGFTLKKIFEYKIIKDYFVVFFIIALLLISLCFIEIRNMNLEADHEYHLISKEIVKFQPNTNKIYPLTSYFESEEILINSDEFDKYFFNERINGVSIRESVTHKTKIISIESEMMNDFFNEAKTKNLSHLLIDLSQNNPKFFKQIYTNEENFPFLKKVYDSNDFDFNYKIKMYEINYELLENMSE